MATESPLVCNMNVFTPAQRESHILATTQLFQRAQRVQNIANGYEFMFPNESECISRIAEFILNERLCCPFLTFTLTILSNSEQVSFSLTGPIGTQEFLQEEFREVF